MSEMTPMWSIMEATTKGKVEEVRGFVRGRYFSAQFGHGMLLIGTDVFATEGQAVEAAKAKVAKRIASLEKTLARVRKNPFAAAPAKPAPVLRPVGH